MCDPSYCIRLLPSCLAGPNLLFSQFLSATEGIQHCDLTAIQAAKILPNVSQHILNSVQILFASSSMDQKSSPLLKILSKPRRFCPHLSSSQPSRGCSQNWMLGKGSDWNAKQNQSCGTPKATWTWLFQRALSTSEEIIVVMGEAARSKLL